MLKPFLPKALLLSLFLITSPAFADDCQTLDKNLATALAQMNTYSRYNYSDDSISDEEKEKKFDQAYNTFKSSFDEMLVKDTSLNCPFTASQGEGLTVKTSPDKKFRAFSWDNDTGGTMHEYSVVLQYENNQGKIHRTDTQALGYVANIFETKVAEKPVYMLVTVDVLSTAMRSQDLTLYKIEQDKLVSPKLIKTKAGLTNNLGYGYWLSEIDTDFHFDAKKKVIDFPVTLPDEYGSGRVTAKRIKYDFDGKYFVKK